MFLSSSRPISTTPVFHAFRSASSAEVFFSDLIPSDAAASAAAGDEIWCAGPLKALRMPGEALMWAGEDHDNHSEESSGLSAIWRSSSDFSSPSCGFGFGVLVHCVRGECSGGREGA